MSRRSKDRKVYAFKRLRFGADGALLLGATPAPRRILVRLRLPCCGTHEPADGPNIPVPAPQVASVIAATITVTAWPAVEGIDRWQVSVSFVKRADRQSAGRSLWLRSRRWLTVTTYPSRLGQPGRYTWRGDRRLNDGDQDHHDVQNHCALV
jgi:hypothetical protein